VRSYRLHVPSEAPAKMFWSDTLCDVDACSLLVNDQKTADPLVADDLKKKGDGSVDIYAGPSAPRGFVANWIPTVLGKSCFAYFRLYEPTRATSRGGGRSVNSSESTDATGRAQSQSV
jgi:hypothetical protein